MLRTFRLIFFLFDDTIYRIIFCEPNVFRIELPMFVPQNRAEKKLHELWLRFLTEINENTEEVSKELLENELIREALGYMEKAAYTKEQLAQYDKWKVDLMSAQSMIDDAEARGEANTLERIVTDAYRNGFSLEQIQLITKLTEKQIAEIFKSNKLQ